jgi:hypothetical protein
MAELSPDDLSREIQRLWARVGSASPAASAEAEIAATPSTQAVLGTELAWDAVALLKRQARQREQTWQRAMDARDEAVRVLRERLEAAETELAHRREREEGDEQRILVETLDARAQIEAAQEAARLAQKRHEEETAVLEGFLAALRDRLAATETAARAAEQRAQARESRLSIDLAELQGGAARREVETARAEADARGARAALAEAKEALAAALAELLIERQTRAQAERDRDAAQRRAEELRAHVEGLGKLWEEERAQWHALWERERAGAERRGDAVRPSEPPPSPSAPPQEPAAAAPHEPPAPPAAPPGPPPDAGAPPPAAPGGAWSTLRALRALLPFAEF